MVVFLQRLLGGLATLTVTRRILRNLARKTISTSIHDHVPTGITHETKWVQRAISFLKNNSCVAFCVWVIAEAPQLRTLYADMRPCQRQQLVQSFYLQQQLDSLNGSDSCFGDGSGDATGQKVFHKTSHRVRHDWLFLVEIRDFWLFQKWPRSSRKPYASPSGRGNPHVS